MFYKARWYDPALGRFAQADPFVPYKYNPLSWDRFSYARNNPLNRIDPTGHVDCNLLGGEDAESCQNEKNRRNNAGADSKPCNCDPESKQGRAEEVFRALEKALGRQLTYAEMLALVAYNEFGTALLPGTDDYNAALEAMARQFYNACGSDGVCEGDELWEFLGAQEAWYSGTVNDFVEQLNSGVLDYDGASQVLNQPHFDPSNTTVEEIRSNWRAGNGVPGIDLGNVPFKYGNYSMFPGEAQVFLPGLKSCNCVDETSVYLNVPWSQYVVMTLGQHYYWTNPPYE